LPLLLDTSVAVELVDEVPRAIQRVAQIDGQYLSVISRVELEAGIYRNGMPDPDIRLRVDLLVDRVEELDFTSREVAAYSSIIAARGFSRRLVVDRMIAATALANDLKLATLNPRDFRDIPGLTIEDWSA
jgi:predicted nucleic acid-binding protein